MAYDPQALIALIREKALKFGEFTLASGKKANFYLDCRKATLDPQGANLIGSGMLELMKANLPDAVGGMAIGADPITGALVTLSGQTSHPLRGFIVRKETKGHGTGQAVEGPVTAGDRVVIVEDVITTGGSALRAIDQAREFGLEVVEALAIIDRLAGGQAAFEQKGVPLRTLLTIRDFGIEPE
ncbi:MAG: orotate phosphoribosyltransferase [Planctomycetaceae bacterium]|jgi:orotate phosphoribosyltransferase|nr:orotate phosphoribosyltransferase [Planctomycetaceae bacterium]